MYKKDFIPNQKAGEEIIFHLRRHWFVFFTVFIFYILLAILPLFLFDFMNQFIGYIFGGGAEGVFYVFSYSYVLALLLFMLTSWMDFYLDVWTITNKRIINREQEALFNRVVSELELSRIQDVAVEQKGFFPTIFHYGDVYVQTAGERERFVFEQIPNPYQIAKKIQHLAYEFKKTNENSNEPV